MKLYEVLEEMLRNLNLTAVSRAVHCKFVPERHKFI